MTKERLRNYQAIRRERHQLKVQLEQLEAMLYYPKIQQMTGMPFNPSKEANPTENLIIKHLELQELYKAKLDELAAEQLAIEQAIEPLDYTARALLRYRYIEGMTWEQVAVKMNYSWRQVHRLHGDALQQLKETTD